MYNTYNGYVGPPAYPMNQPAPLTPDDLSRITADMAHVQAVYKEEEIKTTELQKREAIRTAAEKQRAIDRQTVKAEAEISKEAQSLHAYKIERNIYIVIQRPGLNVNLHKSLFEFPVTSMIAYVTDYPVKMEVWIIKFEVNGKTVSVKYLPMAEESQGRHLMKQLENAGIYLKIPRRIKNDAAEALYEYLVDNIEKMKVPLKPGVIPTECGWRYVGPEEFTLQEVLRNE